MKTTLHKLLTILFLFILPSFPALAQNNNQPSTELNITLGEQRVRFAPTRSFQEMRLEVRNNVGEIVFVNATSEAEFAWNLKTTAKCRSWPGCIPMS